LGGTIIENRGSPIEGQWDFWGEKRVHAADRTCGKRAPPSKGEKSLDDWRYTLSEKEKECNTRYSLRKP